MKENKLSVIIPARNEKYLQKTIENVLENATGSIEIIVICDGYWPDPPIKDNDRVILIHYSDPIGQRQSINKGVDICTGNYIMKLDAHCAVAKGFDEILIRDCEYDMTMIPTMYNLDVTTWQPKLHKKTNYMYITSLSCEKPFRTLYYYDAQPENDRMIDDTMSCMGCCFFMHKDRFLELDGCDENHGGWGQQGIEISCKAWLSGGRLVVNKNTWFAHWFRGGEVPKGEKQGFPYKISHEEVDVARRYSKDLWLNNKWCKQIRPFQFLIDKFKPPTWENRNEYEKEYYSHIVDKKNYPKWFGYEVQKYPSDLIIYQEIIYDKKPDIIVEVGTYKGGSALFFANMFDIIGNGKVISIDCENYNPPSHPRIEYIFDRATNETTLNLIKNKVKNKKVMVVIDSDHNRAFVKRQLDRYKHIVTDGQYIVIERNTYPYNKKEYGPNEAIEWFLRNNVNFKSVGFGAKYIFSQNLGGWLLKNGGGNNE